LKHNLDYKLNISMVTVLIMNTIIQIAVIVILVLIDRADSFRNSLNFQYLASSSSFAQNFKAKAILRLSNAKDNLPVEVNRYMETELNNMIESMDVKDKYAFLIQSISTKILDSSSSKGQDAPSKQENITSFSSSSWNTFNANELKSLCGLYLEMFQVMNIPPTQKSSQSLIDASAIFRDCSKLGYSLQLAKAGNSGSL
jgi:hypothetical protein